MKKLIAVFFFVFSAYTVMWAQPSFSFSSATPCSGDTFCIDVTIEDFTDITALKFPIHWDSKVMRFVGVKNLDLDLLDASDFNEARVSEGLVFMNWVYANCLTNSLDQTDKKRIFSLCFVSTGSYGETSFVEITDDPNILKDNDPEPIEVQRPTGTFCSNIGLRQQKGYISTCVRPLHLFASTENGNPGDLVCTDVSVTGFDGLSGLQFTVEYDSTVLKYASIVLTDKLRNLSRESFGTPEKPGFGEGKVTMSWGWADASVPSISLPDSTVIFQLCHTVVGDCEASSAITFTSNPTKLEAINVVQDTQYLIPIITHDGRVQTGKCAPTGLQLFADCGAPVEINEEVCVHVSSQGMDNLSQFSFLIGFNANILEFKRVDIKTTPSQIPGFSTSTHINKNNVSNGVLGVNWTLVGSIGSATVPAGQTLFDVCFEVVGLGGNAPFSFDPNNAVVTKKGSTANIGIAPNNCSVQVIQPDGIQLEISELYGRQGDTVCVDYTVNRFNDIVELDFSSSWDPTHVKFVEIRDIQLPGLNLDSFGLDAALDGLFSLEWASATPVTLMDGTSLFQVCYEVIGIPPGDLGADTNCKDVEIIDFPISPKAATSTSNGFDIGININTGAVCVVNPIGYYLIVDKAEGYQEEEVCVDFKVAGFQDIVTTDFIVNWDPTGLNYSRVIPKDVLGGLLETQNIRTNSADVGVLVFNWESPVETGASLPDTTSLFEVCFIPIGTPDSCYELSVNVDPFPSARTINGAGSVFPKGGEICIKDRLVITNVEITPVTCRNAANGTVTLEVQGGKGNIFYYWESVPRQFLNKARNLPVGQVAVTIFDQSDPALILRDTFDVPLTDNLPMVNAGTDKVLGCKPPFILLNGSGSTGDEYAYLWSTVTGQLPGDKTKLSTIAGQSGTYVLSVFNTATGCAVSDTMEVIAPTLPVADAGDLQFLSCLADTLVLNGSRSTVGDSIQYIWTAYDGGIINPGHEQKINPTVISAGLYYLEVRNKNNGCSAIDSIRIEEATELPDAKAGLDIELGCSGEGVTLRSDSSINLRPVIYSWFTAGGTFLGAGRQVQVNTLGSYVLSVQEEGSGCIARDTVQVIPSSAYPSINAGVDTIISCINLEPKLNPVIQNSTGFSLSWKAEAGGRLEAGGEGLRNPKVLAAGRFILEVKDSVSTCLSRDTILVTEDTRKPTVEAGAPAMLTCRDPEHTLQGTASSPNGAYGAVWTVDNQTIATDTLRWKVKKAGTYQLTITDKKNGCVATDLVVINSIVDTPIVAVLNVSPTITCTNQQLTLTTTVAPAANYTYNWVTSGGKIVSGGTSLAPTIGAPGIYQLTATNPVNGCMGQATVPVFADTLKPIAAAGADITLTCAAPTGVLNGSASSSGGRIAFSWTGLAGAPTPQSATSNQPSVTMAGQYRLQVRDTFNGCIALDTVQVIMDTLAPKVVLANPAALTCTVFEVNLDGTASDQGAQFTAQWSSLNNQTIGATNNPYLAKATMVGTYQLAIRNAQNGCIGTKTIDVVENRVAPSAVAESNVQLPCQGAVRSLNGNTSSVGANFTYLWRTLTGKGTITDELTLTPKVNTPGVYGLQVTDTQNGCTDTATVFVIVDPQLVMAQAGADQVTCTEDVQLTGNLPAQTTGLWSSKSGASIESPAEFLTESFGLKAGQNIFVWTLSKAECPNYSTDSVIVTREVAPNANNDELVIEAIQRSGSINVAQNDQQAFTNGFNLVVASKPKIGRVDSIQNGVVFYAVAPRIYGKDEFTYKLCSKACPDLCDTAIVKVDVKYDPNLPQEPVANAITPNGDGANDELRFEVLENGDPAIFPDNEMIIFNRWGNIVFQAKPYNNDWKGQNGLGKDLPHGTYYYILRLDISKGLIIQGDVTILK